MIVVSDTSPIRALSHLGRLELLNELYGDVVVPPAVQTELTHAHGRFSRIDLSAYPFITVQAPTNPQGHPALAGLHAGETEAIALALEIKADALLIDEEAGRKAARTLGLRTIGALGILVEGKRAGRVQAVGPLIDKLVNELGFFVAPSLRATVLRSAAEQP